MKRTSIRSIISGGNQSSLSRIGPIPTINKWFSVHTRYWERRGRLGLEQVKYCALMVNICYIWSWYLLQVVQFPNHWSVVERPIVQLRPWMSIQQNLRPLLSVPALYFLVGNIQVSHYLIYTVWMQQVDNPIALYLYVDPKEALQIPLNGQDQFGSLEVLYDLVNLLFIRTRKNCSPSV